LCSATVSEENHGAVVKRQQVYIKDSQKHGMSDKKLLHRCKIYRTVFCVIWLKYMLDFGSSK